MADSIEMARDAIGIMGIDMEDDHKKLPVPSDLATMKTGNLTDIVTLVDVDFAEYRRKNDLRTVRKNCTIPSWLNFEAEKAGVNFLTGIANRAETRTENIRKVNRNTRRALISKGILARLERPNAEKADRINRKRELQGFIDSLHSCPLVLDTWDEKLWTLLVVKGIVHRGGSIVFEFNNGVRIISVLGK